MKKLPLLSLPLAALLGACATATPPPPAPPAAVVPETTQPIVLARATCRDLLNVPPDLRPMPVMFYYGWFAARQNLRTINPANVEPAIRNVMEFCERNPDMTLFQAYPRVLAARAKAG